MILHDYNHILKTNMSTIDLVWLVFQTWKTLMGGSYLQIEIFCSPSKK